MICKKSNLLGNFFVQFFSFDPGITSDPFVKMSILLFFVYSYKVRYILTVFEADILKVQEQK